jgi:hypothetical protein
MKILCDVCEAAAARLFCAADEAALCLRCDEKVSQNTYSIFQSDPKYKMIMPRIHRVGLKTYYLISKDDPVDVLNVVHCCLLRNILEIWFSCWSCRPIPIAKSSFLGVRRQSLSLLLHTSDMVSTNKSFLIERNWLKSSIFVCAFLLWNVHVYFTLCFIMSRCFSWQTTFW